MAGEVERVHGEFDLFVQLHRARGVVEENESGIKVEK